MEALQLLYWHWVLIGLVLIIAEIFLPSFTALWFGLGALLVGGIVWLAPGLNLQLQMLIWAIGSSLFTFLWFRYLRPRMADHTKAGISREAILGQSGQVLRVPEGEQRGLVRFSTPLLGDDEWAFICNDPVASGDRVYVTDVSGNTLIVETRQPAAPL
ncbi:MAG: NfeD family protein [Gammaproteobacteria bacterium]|nr:NfeD family protein [Gammaproteobacteria bacterium]